MARSSCYQGYNQNQIQDQVNNANSAFILISRQGIQSGLIGPGRPRGPGGPGGPGGPVGPVGPDEMVQVVHMVLVV